MTTGSFRTAQSLPSSCADRGMPHAKLDQDDFCMLDMRISNEDSSDLNEELCIVEDFKNFTVQHKDCRDSYASQRRSSQCAVEGNWSPLTKHDLKHGRQRLKSLEFDSLSYCSDDLEQFCVEIFLEVELDQKLHIDRAKLESFVKEIRRRMLDNPYHNWSHVVDVVQSDFISWITDNELIALLIAALCHDIEHPGVGNKFLVDTQSDLAALYGGDIACTEKHHSFRALELLTGSDFGLLGSAAAEDKEEILSLVHGMILATSMDRHTEYMSALRDAIAGRGGPDAPAPAAAELRGPAHSAHRRLVAELLIKCADTSNVLKPFPVARCWALRITDEFFLQGDLERACGMAVTPTCDRHTQSRVALQKGFIDHVIGPFHRAMADLLPGLRPAVGQLAHTRTQWDYYPNDAALMSELARTRRTDTIAAAAAAAATARTATASAAPPAPTACTGPARTVSAP